MYKSYKKNKLAKILLLFLVICMGIPIFVLPAKASPSGGPELPPILMCRARAKAYSDDTLRFTFFLEVWGYVEEYLGGYRLYQFRVFDFGSSDKCSDVWKRQFMGCYATFDSNPGGGTIKGYNQTDRWRIYHKSDSSQYLDFELSAKVHTVYGHSGSVQIITSGDGVCFEFEVEAKDTTYDFNPWELLTIEFGFVFGGTP